MGLSFPHLLILLLVVILLFGRGKISDLMGDLAKGIKSFKKGIADEDEPQTPAKPPLELEAERRSREAEAFRKEDQKVG
ncbi:MULTISPECIES: twin-arginine translocase TatA/TatE family subunit [Rhodomicrobium]|uniref:twin-arginine translocase TatA/TatE family subunit n=1 Tax=Rhodomicrobium TaxID=1068 RepID=UPI000B4A7C57|nr:MULTISPECIES: twin-arginine translocase TatA/TatE family subunit [Rhodomicrobium]